jgi:MFS family permease
MMLGFMMYAAALPLLLEAWGMSGTAAGSIATSAQLAYAISLMLFSWLADRLARVGRHVHDDDHAVRRPLPASAPRGGE